MANQSEETKIAVLAEQMKSVVDTNKGISSKLDSLIGALPNTYLTLKEHAEFVSAVEKRFTQVEADQRARDNQNEVSKWMERLSIAGTTAVIVYLVNFYLTHGGALK